MKIKPKFLILLMAPFFMSCQQVSKKRTLASVDTNARIVAYKNALDSDVRFENVKNVSVSIVKSPQVLGNGLQALVNGVNKTGIYGSNTCGGDYIEELSFIDNNFSYECNASVCKYNESDKFSVSIHKCTIKDPDETMLFQGVITPDK